MENLPASETSSKNVFVGEKKIKYLPNYDFPERCTRW